MESIGKVMPGVSLQACSPQATAPVPRRDWNEKNLPLSYDHTADVAIPDRVWRAWQDDGKPRMLRRPLDDAERKRLQSRALALASCLLPFDQQREKDRVAAAIDGLIASYGSSRVSDGGLLARISGIMETLAELPAWAIEAGCQKIRARGYTVVENGVSRTEQRWSPSEAQIRSEVLVQMEQRSKALKSAQQILAAPVAPQIELNGEKVSVEASLADFKRRIADGHLDQTRIENARRERVLEGMRKRNQEARRLEYLHNGLEPPTPVNGCIPSLPLMLQQGYTIEGKPGQKVLVAPDRPAPGPIPTRKSRAAEMGS